MIRRALIALVLTSAGAASADSNDLVLSRLGTRVMNASGGIDAVIGENLEFRALASQLGVVLAPHLLTPADTLGFGGFQFDVDASQTTIDSKADYWRARVGTSGDTMRTIGFFVRKGMWFPLPSFELGAGAVHLVDSHTWTGQLYAKLGLHEGYHDLPIPSIAARGAVSRMMNQRELDLTVASLDITASYHIGVGGTWRIDPFVGWNLLMIIPRSEVIDPTPNVDPLAPGNEKDSSLNFVFKDQSTIYRNRFLVGAKLQYYIVQLTLEAEIALAGSSVDDRPGTSDACEPMSTTVICDAKDTAKAQTTVSLSAGVDF